MKRLHDLVWPIAKAPEVVGSELCLICYYRDSCGLLLSYHWINEDFVFFDCVIRIRNYLAAKEEEQCVDNVNSWN